MNPEVVFLRPLHGETKRETAWQCLMVEFGIHFAFDEQYQLPDRLPADLTGVKAIVIDPASWDEYHAGETGKEVARFIRSGGIIFQTRGPEQFDGIDENAIRGDFDMMIASANLTMNHPRLRDRLQARTFRQLYESLRESYFLHQIEYSIQKGWESAFNEPFAYLLMQTMEQFDKYDPSFGWHERQRRALDAVLELTQQLPQNLERLPVLESFVRMSKRTGDRRYLEFAVKMVRRAVETHPRLEGVVLHQPGRDHVLWNECLVLLPPNLVALGVILGDEALVNLAVHTAHTLHRLNYDPAKKLWVHWAAPGRRCPAIWARGQGWALAGLVGILRYLPEN